MYQLEIVNDVGKRSTFSISEGTSMLTIGRKKENDIVFSDVAVSRHHAQLYLKGEKLWIEDLNSANGVMVNQARITDATALQAGDEVQIGDNRFTVIDTDF